MLLFQGKTEIRQSGFRDLTGESGTGKKSGFDLEIGPELVWSFGICCRKAEPESRKDNGRSQNRHTGPTEGPGLDRQAPGKVQGHRQTREQRQLATTTDQLYYITAGWYSL